MAKTKKETSTQRVTRRSDGNWQHKGDDNKRASRVTRTQKEAIDSAKSVAQRKKSEVVVHGKDGKIRSKDSYGRDPISTKDKEH
jgi:uncharacterized protein YdaT